jgi:hypothetical protein
MGDPYGWTNPRAYKNSITYTEQMQIHELDENVIEGE